MSTYTVEKGQPGGRSLFRDRYLLHKLHSLSGIVPIGLFLIFHLTANSYSLKGETEFNTAVKAIGYAPFIVLMEIAVIAVPILFHAIYGLMIVAEMPGPGGNVSHYGYGRNWLYVLQRWSGVLAIVYILYHVWDTTVLKYSIELTAQQNAKELGFQSISYRAMAWRFADPAYLAFYVVGIASACLHLGNGILNFCIRWGITVGKEAQRIAAVAGWGLGFGLTALGIAVAVNFGIKGRPDRQANPDRTAFIQSLAGQSAPAAVQTEVGE
jgi:succinate dehydrogenase / fumarate reductase cytochrome b subunit